METANKTKLSPEASDGRHSIVDLNIATLHASSAETFDNICESDLTGGRREGSLYDTPPASFSDAVSPMSSRKNGVLQAESLGLTPTGGRNRRMSTPTLPDRDGLKLAPINFANLPPFTEEVRQHSDVREPLPVIPPSTIAHRFQSSTSGRFLSQSTRKPMVSGLSIPQDLQPRPYMGEEFWKSVRTMRERFASNPYEDRADEIGPSHDIPGVGHIGDLLAPPGWTMDSAPFEPEKIHELYNISRKAAKDDLAMAMANLTKIPAQEREKVKATRDEKWKAGLKLDKFLKEERLGIWQNHMKLKARWTAYENFVRRTFEIPQVMYPPSETSIPYQCDTMRPQLPALFPSRLDPVGVSVMQDIPSSRSAHVGFASPTILDPYLATGSYEAIISRYNARKAQIEQELRDNENILSSFMNEYGNRFSNGAISPSRRSSTANQQNDAPSHRRRDNISEGSRPLAYISPTHTRHVSFSRSSTWDHQLQSPAAVMVQSFPPAMIRANNSTPVAILPSQPDDSACINVPRLQDDLHHFYELNSKPASTVSGTTIASTAHPTVAKKTRVRKKPTEKYKPWYQAQLEGVNLPISNIGHDAMQAGIEYGRTGISAKKTVSHVSGHDQVPATKSEIPKKTPKKRREKKTYDPAVPFFLSKDASKKFMALYPGLVQGLPNFQQTTNADFAMPHGEVNSTPQLLSTGKENVNFVFPSGSQAQVSIESPIESVHKENDDVIKNAPFLSRGQQSLDAQTETGHDATTTYKDIDSELSTLSSTDHEDPNDANFRVRTTHSKATATKASVAAGVKRKSVATTVKTKRPRTNNTGQIIDRGVEDNDHRVDSR